MKHTILISALALFIASPALADNGFGEPFTNSGHAALEDPISAENIADIEPAAGTETPDYSVHSTDTNTDTQKETELEQKFDSEVTHSEIRRDDQQITRDRVGEGDIGVFYEHTKDERIMDTDDAIGVEVKLIEFE